MLCTVPHGRGWGRCPQGIPTGCSFCFWPKTLLIIWTPPLTSCAVVRVSLLTPLYLSCLLCSVEVTKAQVSKSCVTFIMHRCLQNPEQCTWHMARTP